MSHFFLKFGLFGSGIGGVAGLGLGAYYGGALGAAAGATAAAVAVPCFLGYLLMREVLSACLGCTKETVECCIR